MSPFSSFRAGDSAVQPSLPIELPGGREGHWVCMGGRVCQCILWYYCQSIAYFRESVVWANRWVLGIVKLRVRASDSDGLVLTLIVS